MCCSRVGDGGGGQNMFSRPIGLNKSLTGPDCLLVISSMFHFQSGVSRPVSFVTLLQCCDCVSKQPTHVLCKQGKSFNHILRTLSKVVHLPMELVHDSVRVQMYLHLLLTPHVPALIHLSYSTVETSSGRGVQIPILLRANRANRGWKLPPCRHLRLDKSYSKLRSLLSKGKLGMSGQSRMGWGGGFTAISRQGT